MNILFIFSVSASFIPSFYEFRNLKSLLASAQCAGSVFINFIKGSVARSIIWLRDKIPSESIYTWVSTSMQVDGYSLDAQKEKLRKYAEIQELVIAGEYSDDGITGRKIGYIVKK